MMMLTVDTKDWREFDGLEVGRELDLELTAVVTKVELHPIDGGSPSERATLVVVRADILQTT